VNPRASGKPADHSLIQLFRGIRGRKPVPCHFDLMELEGLMMDSNHVLIG